MADPNWGEFEMREAVPIEDAMAKRAWRVFASADGQEFLKYLRAQTKERVLSPDASDAVLRHLEGQRFLVSHIETLIERGKK